jgi:hypothetical protein
VPRDQLFLAGIAAGSAVGALVAIAMFAAGWLLRSHRASPGRPGRPAAGISARRPALRARCAVFAVHRRTPGGFAPRLVDRLAVAASLAGVGSGLVIATLGDTALFDPWWDGFAAAFPDASRARALRWFAPIGALVVLHYAPLLAIAWRSPDRAWVGRAGALSVAAWFVVDSAGGLALGGAFNVLMINLPALALTLPPFAALWWLSSPRGDRRPSPPARPARS